MTLSEFMSRCLAAGCVIVPTRGYSGYNADGNIDQALFVGARYAAIRIYDVDTVAPDFWGMVGEQYNATHETPEAALEHYESTLSDTYARIRPED